MASPLTIDASVFLNANNSFEKDHEASRQLLEKIHHAAHPIICPTLVWPEISAAIGRTTGNSKLALELTQALSVLPHIAWIPVDEVLAKLAAELAAAHQFRGGDAVYVSPAHRYGCVLVTLDHEMYERSPEDVGTKYPYEILSDFEKK